MPVFESALNALRQGDNAALALLALSLLTLLLVFGFLLLLAQTRRLSRRLARLSGGMENANLEETLAAHLETVAQTVRRMETLEQAVAVLQAQIPHCMQRSSLLRYDAFDDVGGEQSFSLALLDAKGDGLVITSVHSRQDVRVYAKAIAHGRASHALSKEEERTLREAALA